MAIRPTVGATTVNRFRVDFSAAICAQRRSKETSEETIMVDPAPSQSGEEIANFLAQVARGGDAWAATPEAVRLRGEG